MQALSGAEVGSGAVVRLGMGLVSAAAMARFFPPPQSPYSTTA